jgi:hypothetical protein
VSHFQAETIGESARLQLLQNLLVCGKSTDLVLAEDALTVDLDVEDAAAALDQVRPRAGFFLNSVRQTGGLGFVVSLHAVSDGYRHFGSFLKVG